ncbi:hypothetical protein [Microcella sp.]|uniref:hypothetical protein n=1 Tax=Microcella sp. TaxID=1913979 RepID=UPI00256592D5|nr:hypothetical protein [Microcella sp.]MBX9473070.1 hypothetical protein [Microcella sp.]
MVIEQWVHALAVSSGAELPATVCFLDDDLSAPERAAMLSQSRPSLRAGGEIAVVSPCLSVVEMVDLMIGAGFTEVRVSVHRSALGLPGHGADDEVSVVLARAIRPLRDAVR